jgi:hypothetical protein
MDKIHRKYNNTPVNDRSLMCQNYFSVIGLLKDGFVTWCSTTVSYQT